MVSQTTQQAKPSTGLSAAIGPLLWAGRTLTALVQEVRQIAILVDHRRQLSRLTEHDDRMLADIGLSRCDLMAAHSAPLWQDSTTVLKRRVNESGTERATERPASQASEEASIPVMAIYFASR